MVLIFLFITKGTFCNASTIRNYKLKSKESLPIGQTLNKYI